MLVVDDTPANLSLLTNVLDKTYRVKVATSGQKALDIALGPAAANPALRDLVEVLRGYWVRDPGATDHRYGQARHYINLSTQDLGCFWEVTRKARNAQPLP